MVDMGIYYMEIYAMLFCSSERRMESGGMFSSAVSTRIGVHFQRTFLIEPLTGVTGKITSKARGVKVKIYGGT